MKQRKFSNEEAAKIVKYQGRSQVFWKGGAQLKGEGEAPRKLWGFNILQTVWSKCKKIVIFFLMQYLDLQL